MNELVVFDCDGTLVDSQHVILAAMHAAFDALGLPRCADQDVRRIVGLSLPEALAALLGEELGADQALLDRLVRAYRQAFVDLRSRDGHQPEPLYPGILESLRSLSDKGHLLAVATGKSMRGLRLILQHHGIEHLFISLQTADHHPSKPHPAMLQAAMSEAGAAPERTVLVGDTSYDMRMARNAGTFGLGVDWGYHGRDELKAAGADAIAMKGADIPSFVSTFLRDIGP